MKITVDSDEYRCWHEVGHAIVCLHLGGDVDFIELLSGDTRGHARARCVVTPEIERSVACGGFAAEVYLLKFGHAELDRNDKRDINGILFHNATSDRENFWGRKLDCNEEFTKMEDTEFMHQAIGLDGHSGLVPIFKKHFSQIEDLVRELSDSRIVKRERIRELLRLDNQT